MTKRNQKPNSPYTSLKYMPAFEDIQQLADLYHIMGDHTRISLLFRLMNGEQCVGELAADMLVTESAVSHQLHALRTAKLVRARRAGKQVFYSLNDSHVEWILQNTLEHINEP